jgi:hypothetical protein
LVQIADGPIDGGGVPHSNRRFVFPVCHIREVPIYADGFI